MKKLIALLLAIGMVVSLGACKKPAQGSGSTGTNESTTGSIKQTDTPPQSTAPADAPSAYIETNTPPQEIVSGSEENQAAEKPVAETEQPDWTMLKTFPVFAGPKSTSSEECAIHRLTYETWQETANTMTERHASCAFYGYCEYYRSAPCETGYFFRTNFYNYDKTYFTENTMLVITLRLDAGNDAQLKDVHYADGIVTCSVETSRPVRRELDIYRTIYVQLDEAIPEDTQLKVEIINQQEQSEISLQWNERYYSLSGWVLYDKDSPKIAYALDWESYQEFAAECVKRGTACPNYSKAFFDDHTLIVVGWAAGSGSDIFDLHNLHYADGTLTCSIDIPYFDGLFSNANIAQWICYIEVNTVLPADTQVILDMGSMKYDQDTYKQKRDEFRTKC